MGTGFRKCSFSRPPFRLLTTRPASSSSFRCFITPKRVIVEPRLERAERLAVLSEQLVEQAPPGGIRKGSEHLVHAHDREYVTDMVTCQVRVSRGLLGRRVAVVDRRACCRPGPRRRPASTRPSRSCRTLNSTPRDSSSPWRASKSSTRSAIGWLLAWNSMPKASDCISAIVRLPVSNSTAGHAAPSASTRAARARRRRTAIAASTSRVGDGDEVGAGDG